ncbi:MAG: 4-hydroxythreonine-4-phosphate dehydrogenase PdxA, partial [Muribaculaceae bacterium]
MSTERKIRVGITQGDINGIGYEVILKTLIEPRILELCTPVLYGSSKIAAYHRKALEMPQIPFNNISSANEVKDNVNNLVEVINDDTKVELGVQTPAAGKAAFIALECAIADLKAGLIDVLVTAPINKHSIQSNEFQFPGHTEYLEAAFGEGKKPLMVLFNERIKVALVTTHLPISKIPESITATNIAEKLEIF